MGLIHVEDGATESLNLPFPPRVAAGAAVGSVTVLVVGRWHFSQLIRCHLSLCGVSFAQKGVLGFPASSFLMRNCLHAECLAPLLFSLELSTSDL